MKIFKPPRAYSKTKKSQLFQYALSNIFLQCYAFIPIKLILLSSNNVHHILILVFHYMNIAIKYSQFFTSASNNRTVVVDINVKKTFWISYRLPNRDNLLGLISFKRCWICFQFMCPIQCSYLEHFTTG